MFELKGTLGLVFKTSWRSLWRNRRRTLISIAAIAFGMAMAIFFIAFADGVYGQLISDATRMYGGHFTVEHREYREAPAVDLVVQDVSLLRQKLEGAAEVAQTKALILGQGVIKSGRGAVGISIFGVEPEIEEVESPLARRIVAGDYLEKKDDRKVVVGRILAERLKVSVGKKVVITTNDANGDLVEEMLRVKGVFSLGSDEVDAYFAQVPLGTARRLYGLGPDAVTQVGVLLRDDQTRPQVLERVAPHIAKESALRTWEEVLPELANYVRVDRASNLIFQGVIVFLSLFTIFNTLVMSVLERSRTFAMQLALGAPVTLLRLQVLTEALVLGALGATLGVLLGGGMGYWLEQRGFDIAFIYREGVDVSGFSIDTVVHADVTPGLLLVMWILVVGTTLLLSLIPMRRLGRIAIADVLR